MRRLEGGGRRGCVCAQARAACDSKGQGGPLLQRLALLESFVAESALNAPLREMGADVAAVAAPGALVVADLTDPLLSAEEATGVFTLLVEARAPPPPLVSQRPPR